MTPTDNLKICLVRPPAALAVNAINRFSIPPVGLAYIAAAVRTNGFCVQVVDSIGEAIQQYSYLESNSKQSKGLHYGLKFDEILARIDPDVDAIGVSIMFSREWLHCRALLEKIRERFPSALLIVGGEHITACCEYSMKDCPAIDVAVLGEGEATIVDLLRAHEESRDLSTVAGIAFRNGEKIIRTSPRKRIENVDSIPQPAWDLFPLKEYIRYACGIGFDLGPSAPILASRGCPFRCTFCSNPMMWNTKWYARSPTAVLEEMKSYMAQYGVTNFNFYDLTAIVKKDWILDFCRLVVSEGLTITWQLPSGTRSEALDSETLGWLYRAGCRSVIYAPESGSPPELARIQKKVIPSRMLESMKIAHEKGILTKANIIFGMPGASWGDVIRTYRFLIAMAKAGVNDVGCFSFSPYPGSEMYNQLVAENKIHLDDEYFRALNSFSNFTRTTSFNPNFSGFQLSMINFMGMTIFYSTNMLFRPKRFISFLGAIFRGDISSALGRALSNLRKRKMASKLLDASDSDTVQLPITPRYE